MRRRRRRWVRRRLINLRRGRPPNCARHPHDAPSSSTTLRHHHHHHERLYSPRRSVLSLSPSCLLPSLARAAPAVGRCCCCDHRCCWDELWRTTGEARHEAHERKRPVLCTAAPCLELASAACRGLGRWRRRKGRWPSAGSAKGRMEDCTAAAVMTAAAVAAAAARATERRRQSTSGPPRARS